MFVVPLSRSAALARSAAFDRFVDRLFDDSFARVPAAPSVERTPAMDIIESDSAYTIAFDVPGATRERLKVSIDGRKVTLATADALAETPPAASEKAAPASERVLHRERGAAAYARSVSLPAEVDQQASQARFENGVLTLVLAKKVPTGATQLPIA